MPVRSDFDPVAIPSLLPHIAIHDLSVENDSILRLVGTGLVHRFGFDPTNKSYRSVVPEDRQEVAIRALRDMAEFPYGMHVIIDWLYATGYRQNAESVGFPLRQNGGGTLLIFIDIPFEDSVRDVLHRTELKGIGVLERELIDIGAGLPTKSN